MINDDDPVYEIGDYKLVQTCGGCPEQYDVYNANNEKVGYMRLRHGYFGCWDASQSTLYYEANPEGDGIFEYAERMIYLREAVMALAIKRAGLL